MKVFAINLPSEAPSKPLKININPDKFIHRLNKPMTDCKCLFDSISGILDFIGKRQESLEN